MSALCVHCEQPEQRHAHGMCPIVAYGELQGWHPVNRFTTRDVMSIDLKRHRDSSAIPHHVGESPATVQPASQPEDEIPCRHCAKLPNDHHCGDARFCELRPSERLSYEPQPANAAAGDSLIAAIEGNYAGMSHADLVLTCKMLERGRATWRKEAEEAQSRINSPGCLFAGPGRGDCEHFVGLPGELVDGHNTDTYGKPNGWCWYCWLSYRTHKAEKRCAGRWKADFMSSIHEKVDYVLRQGQTRDHHCHWPGCKKQVPPAMWGCRAHWFRLPKRLRDRIWLHYKPGQETNWTPSLAYLQVAKDVQEWIKEYANEL